MSSRRLNDLLNLAHVQHWHNVPTFRKPSVAEHSFRVAAIALELSDQLNLHDLTKLKMLEWAIMHDGPEAETGDLPGPMKKLLPFGVWAKLEEMMCPWYNKFKCSITVHSITRIADRMETLLFIMEAGRGTEAKAAEANIRKELMAEIASTAKYLNVPDLAEKVDRVFQDAFKPSDTRHVPFLRLRLVDFPEHGTDQQHAAADQNASGSAKAVDTLPSGNAQHDRPNNPKDQR